MGTMCISMGTMHVNAMRCGMAESSPWRALMHTGSTFTCILRTTTTRIPPMYPPILWVQIGFTQRQVVVDRMLCGSSAGWSRRTLSVLFPEDCLSLGSPGVWRGWLAYTAPASGAPRGYKTSSASIGIGYPECIFHTPGVTPDRLHSNERGRRHCGVDLRVAPASGERADEQGPHSVRRLTRADSTVRLPIRTVQ